VQVEAAATDRAVENEYLSIRKQQQQHSSKTSTTGDDSCCDDDDDDDPLYESIAGSAKSDSSPDVTPEPCKVLCEQQLYESSDL